MGDRKSRLPAGLGLTDEIFVHELCLELKMTRGELERRMSAHELTVQWPEFFAWRARENERQANIREAKAAAPKRL